MEVDEIEVVLEKIWDLHDKLSDAIHAISRAHFVNSTKNPARDGFYFHRKKKSGGDDIGQKAGHGFVFVKEFQVDDDELAVQEAKSLFAIRTALEHLEDQLEFFHTVQTHQRAERDSAIARLEQSRIILALRLAEHQGKNYKVIEEATALVGDVQYASRFTGPENLFNINENFKPQQNGKKSNPFATFFFSSFTFVSKSLKLDHAAGILGNAAIFAISMLAFVSINQVCSKENYTYETRRISHMQQRPSTSSGHIAPLDVTLARG